MHQEKNAIVSLVRGINSSSEEIATCSKDINDFTASHIDMVKGVHGYSEELNELAMNLTKSVESFKI